MDIDEETEELEQESEEEGVRHRLFVSKHTDALPRHVADFIHPLRKRVEIMTRVLDMNSSDAATRSRLRSLATQRDDEYIQKHEPILPRSIAEVLTARQRREACRSILLHRPDIPTDLFRVKEDLRYVEKYLEVLPLEISKCLFPEERRQVRGGSVPEFGGFSQF